MSANADRIAQLTADLAEAHAVAAALYTAAMKSRSCKAKGIIRRIFGPLRTVTGAALAEARRERIEQERKEKREQWAEVVRQRDESHADHERTKAELVHTREQLRFADADATKLNTLRAERDAAIAREQAAQAEILKAGHEKAVMRQRLEAAQAEAAAMRDWCAAWLIRARLAVYREGWEEGMSVRETTEALSAVLANIGCDDGTERPDDIAETKRLLAMPVTYRPPGGRALAARVPLWKQLESIMRTDGNIGLIDDVLAKLAALDEKGGV